MGLGAHARSPLRPGSTSGDVRTRRGFQPPARAPRLPRRSGGGGASVQLSYPVRPRQFEWKLLKMAAAGAEARGGEGWRAAPLTVPRSPGKLPRPGKRGRDSRACRRVTRRDAASLPADTLAPKGALRASPLPRSLTLLTPRPARSPQSPPAPRFRGARSARAAPRSAVSRSAEVPRTPWPGLRCPLGRRPLPAWSPCGGIRAAAAAPGNPRGWGCSRACGHACGLLLCGGLGGTFCGRAGFLTGKREVPRGVNVTSVSEEKRNWGWSMNAKEISEHTPQFGRTRSVNSASENIPVSGCLKT